jgi:hypothetical protein
VSVRRNRSFAYIGTVAVLTSCFAIVGSASAASTTLIFEEPERGATFAFIDHAPKIGGVRGVRAPKKFSSGDEFIFTNRLEVAGKTVGKLRGVCTATQTSSLKNIQGAGFLCNAQARIPGGTLFLVTPFTEGATGPEGAVIGGTGKYAGARGSFVIKQGRNSSTNTITLLE